MSDIDKRIVHEFFAALAKGDVPDRLLDPEMTVWTASGPIDKTSFQGGMRLYASIFSDGPHYRVDSIIAEENRAAVEVRSSGTLINGEAFVNTHVYIVEVRNGAIAHVAEHMNEIVVRDQIGPLMQAAMAKITAA